eukprot:SAG11_NODE_1646_length_4523_cov_1.447559_4_plen_176_part_00
MVHPWFYCQQPEPFQMWAPPLTCSPPTEFVETEYPVLVPRPLSPIFELAGFVIDRPCDSAVGDCKWAEHKNLAQSYRLYPAFTTTIEVLPAQMCGVLLAVFASLVAPFGGFFASAIKRAYDAKVSRTTTATAALHSFAPRALVSTATALSSDLEPRRTRPPRRRTSSRSSRATAG